MKFEQMKFGSVNGKDVHKFVVNDEKGFNIELSDLGATILSVQIPDREGIIKKITYGHDNPEAYLNTAGYLGATIGRIANRIQNAEFELGGQVFKITPNHKVVHQIHGGLNGFDKKIWTIISEETGLFEDEVRIMFSYLSKDGEEGYPGNLAITLLYRIRSMRIEWEFEATTDNTTIINLTNHTYWNLNGIHTLIDDLEFTLYAKKYSVVDDDLIPTGVIENFPIDLTKSCTFEDVFDSFGDIDHNFFLINYLFENTALDVFPAGILYSPKTGIKMTVETSEPCIQVYTGNFMGEIYANSKKCEKHGAVCLETQRIPNAINIAEFRKSVILRPDKTYRHKTRHMFEIVS